MAESTFVSNRFPNEGDESPVAPLCPFLAKVFDFGLPNETFKAVDLSPKLSGYSLDSIGVRLESGHKNTNHDITDGGDFTVKTFDFGVGAIKSFDDFVLHETLLFA